MATISSQSTLTSGRAQNYAKKDAVAISAIGAAVPLFEKRLQEIRVAHGKDGVQPKALTDDEGKVVRDEAGNIVAATDSQGNTIYESKYVQAYSLVESFGHDELDPDDPESWSKAQMYGRSLVEDRFPGHPALIATEINGRSGCVHNHIILGAIHPETGKSIDSNRLTHSRLAIAHDRVLAEHGFEQRADMREAVRDAENRMAVARAEIEKSYAGSGISDAQLQRKITAAENKITVQHIATDRTVSQERADRRMREYDRYLLNEQNRAAAIDIGVAPEKERFSEIVLESRIREALDDPRSKSWDDLGEVGREHGVTVERRGKDVTYGLMLADRDGDLAEPARAHRRRGKSLGEGFRVEDVESALEANSLERAPHVSFSQMVANVNIGQDPDKVASQDDASDQPFEEMLAEAKAELGFEDPIPVAVGPAAEAASEAQIRDDQSSPVPGQVIAAEVTLETTSEPGFRSKLRDREVSREKARETLDKVAALEENFHGRQPDSEFETRAKEIGIGPRLLKTYGKDLDPEFRKILEDRAAQAAERSRAYELLKRQRAEHERLTANPRLFDENYDDRLRRVQRDARFYTSHVESIDTSRAKGDYTSREPERVAYLDKKRGSAEAARQQRVNELEGTEENSVNLESAKPMTEARRKALEQQLQRRERNRATRERQKAQGNDGLSM